MPFSLRGALIFAACLLVFAFLFGFAASAQSSSSSATLQGVVTDPTGAVVPGVTVQIENPVSGYTQTAQTDASGAYAFKNIPFNPYHLSVTATGFKPYTNDVALRSAVPVKLDITLQVGAAGETVLVEAAPGAQDLIETDPSTHTDLDRSLAARLPSESTNAALSSLVTLGSPGVVADSNGFFHPLGEHADTTFSIDGQPISDQQSRIFANQISVDAVQSLEVINGVSPAEFGDKSSLVIRTTTRSGLGSTRPTGSISMNYGSFGTTSGGLTFGVGNKTFGNFLSVDGVNSGRFLDTPEFTPLHAHGNTQNFFNRLDWQAGPNDNFHLNLFSSRSWFQQPNQFDQEALGQDQRQQNRNWNVAGFWTHLFSPNLLLSVNPYVRQDRINYYPSSDPFSDTPATLASNRHLTNIGFKTDLSYVKGIHNFKAGFDIYGTLLRENFSIGVTDPAFNPVCLDPSGAPISDPSVLDPACAGPGQQPNPNFLPGVLSFDLTRGGTPFLFNGATTIHQQAVYVQDNITLGSWTFMLGLRGDNYSGLSSRSSIQPRTGVTYLIKPTGTVLRAAYGRFFLTPYNENLLLSSSTGSAGLSDAGVGAFGESALKPGRRNQFNAGLEQAFGKYLVVDADYYWKFTQDDFDFDILFNTSLTFPIQWRKSKIDGFAIRLNMPQHKGVTAFTVLGHTRDRFFTPEQGGILFNNPADIAAPVFRIDHDQAFQQTTHLQWQPKKTGPWAGFSWRYDSGLVAGNAPFASDPTTPVDLTFLTGDQQAQIKLSCGGVRATVNAPITSCAPNLLSSPLVTIPAPGAENDDRNPPRIAPHHLFDVGLGWDNFLHRERYKMNARFTIVNLTNQVSLYNFLSTFSGTHFITPRTFTGGLTVNF